MIKKVLFEDTSRILYENDFVHIADNQKVRHTYEVILNQEVEEQKHYRELFSLLRSATHEDKFVFYLNNNGGYLDTALELINAMKASVAPIAAIVSGSVYSAAPLIVLQADLIKMEEDSFMMFHDYSGGMSGKGSEMAKGIIHYQEFFDGFFKKTTKGFLTEKEQQDILDGKDLYVRHADCKKRLKRMRKLIDANEKITI